MLTIVVITRQKNTLANVSVPVIGNLDVDHGFNSFPANFLIYDKGFRVLVSREITPWPSPCGVNCSYTVSFAGPAYDCIEMGPLSSLSVNLTALWSQNINVRLRNQPSFLNSSISYMGLDDLGNETSPVKFWMVYDQLNQTLRCDLYNATYTTNVSYENNVQLIRADVVRNNPIVDGNRLFENHTIDLYEFNEFSIHEAVASMLYGWVTVVDQNIVPHAYITSWEGVVQLTNSTPMLIFPDNMGSIVEDFMTNVTISQNSLRDNPDPDVASFIVEQTTVAMVTAYPLIYTYSAPVLWQIYGTALAISMACIAIGSYMLFKNGTLASLSLSQVLITTRNPTLDRLCNDEGLKKSPLRYGVLGETNHMCFGTDTEIRHGVLCDRRRSNRKVRASESQG